MGTWIYHLRVTKNVLPHFPGLDEVTFAFGNLAPDSGIPNADWTQFDPPKEVTHFLKRGEGEYAIHDLIFYEQYLANIQPEADIKLYSFRLGYFFHLICDYMWARCIARATERDFKEQFDQDRKETWSLVKGDWYGLDQLYVREHPENLFWHVILPSPDPPSYLLFIKNEALHHEYEHIRKYYSQPEDQWFLSIPYRYLNEKTMRRIVNDALEAILLIQPKLQDMQNLHGLKSSVNLLPESLTTPYEKPLGNTTVVE